MYKLATGETKSYQWNCYTQPNLLPGESWYPANGKKKNPSSYYVIVQTSLKFCKPLAESQIAPMAPYFFLYNCTIRVWINAYFQQGAIWDPAQGL